MAIALKGEQLVQEGVRTVQEATQFTRLSRSKLYAEMEAGRLAYVTVGRRRLIPMRALTEMLARGLRGGG